jgi:hypothetical protein
MATASDLFLDRSLAGSKDNQAVECRPKLQIAWSLNQSVALASQSGHVRQSDHIAIGFARDRDIADAHLDRADQMPAQQIL